MLQNKLIRGFGHGVIATIAMSIPMVVALVSGFSPMPQPIPMALVATVLGGNAPKPLLMALAVGLHLAYGGLFGVILAGFAGRVTVANGIALGVALWGLMQIAVLPFLGWGLFGAAITPKIAAATFVLHLVYGGTLGWTLGRHTSGPGKPSPSTG